MSIKDTLKNLVPHHDLQFAPVEEDDDELSKAITNDPAAQDDQWQLSDNVDAEKLEAFWDNAAKELGTLQSEDSE